jgi:hypothetical protein
MGKYCLMPKLAEEFKAKLKSGEIDPAKLSTMTSQQRNEYFKSFLGENNAKNVNALFERKILAKRRWDAMIKWAKETTGIKPEVRRDLVSKIEKMVQDKNGNLLSPAEEKSFLQDLASTKLGVDVSFDEAKKITELSNIVSKAKEEAGDFTNYDKRIEYGNKLIDMYDYMASLKSGKGIIDQLTNVANVPRALMSTFDLSAPFRQGFGMVSRKNFWKNLTPMVKSFFSEKAFREIQADIITRPNYQSMKQSGLRLTGLGDKLTEREEEFMTTLLDKIPGIRSSERAYTGFLAKLRADMYDQFIKKAELLGEDVKGGSKYAKDIADMVNNFTGAGKVGKIDQASPILNSLFFSPRKIAATIQKLNPQRYLDPRISPTARKEAFKNILGMVGASTTILSLAKLGGADIETDPRSSDFGKVVIGNTRFDVTGGDGNYATLLARLATNQTKSTTSDIIRTLGEDYGTPTRGDTLIKFFRNKLSPTSSFIADWLYGENAIGEVFDLKQEVLDRITPMIISSSIEAAAEDPTMGVAAAMADLIGIGTQTYDSSVDWNQSTGKELLQFKEKIGQDKFNQANEEYNKIIAEKTKKIIEDERYIKLSDEDKKIVLEKLKTTEKDKLYKKYNFTYKQDKKESVKTKEFEQIIK